jgi:hypothetical protein
VLKPSKDAPSGHYVPPFILPLEASNLAQISQMRYFLIYA